MGVKRRSKAARTAEVEDRDNEEQATNNTAPEAKDGASSEGVMGTWDERVSALRTNIEACVADEEYGATKFAKFVREQRRSAEAASAGVPGAAKVETALVIDLEVALRAAMTRCVDAVLAEPPAKKKRSLAAVTALANFTVSFVSAMGRPPSPPPEESTAAATAAAAAADEDASAGAQGDAAAAASSVSAAAPFSESNPYFCLQYAILEDACDRLPKAFCVAIWHWVDAARRRMATERGSGAGYLPLLRLCNGLLRRFSRERDAAACGRVLVFLTEIMPLTERSALNVQGRTNTDNKTPIATKEEFDAQMGGFSTTAAAADDLEMTDAATVPASTAAATAAAATAASGAAKKGGDAEVEEAAGLTLVDFDCYMTIWGLQKALQDPLGLVSSPEAFAEICARVDRVLAIFEAHKLSAHDLLVAAAVGSSAGVGAGGGGGVSHAGGGSSSNAIDVDVAAVSSGGGDDSNGGDNGGDNGTENGGGDDVNAGGDKYLTGPRLLPYQLRDPAFRLHVLGQVLILQQALRVPPRPPANHPPPVVPAEVDREVRPLAARARRLAEATPPGGAALLQLLDRTIQREWNFAQWKNTQCKVSFERFGGPAAPVSDAITVIDPRPDKKAVESKAGAAAVATGGTAADQAAAVAAAAAAAAAVPGAKRQRRRPPPDERELRELASRYVQFDVVTALPTVTARLLLAVPTLERFLEAYREADDPENMIEDVEHPKHDPAYRWRALRLMSRERLTALADCFDGSLPEAVARLDGKDPVAIRAAAAAEAAAMKAAAATAAATNAEGGDHGTGGGCEAKDTGAKKAGATDGEETANGTGLDAEEAAVGGDTTSSL